MRVTDLGIRTKILLGFGIVLLLMLLTGIISFTNSVAFSQVAQNRLDILNITQSALEKEIAHLKWSASISRLFVSNEQQFNLQPDPTKCEFGKWLYSTISSTEFSLLPENIQNTLLSMKMPHARLHESVEKLHVNWHPLDNEATGMCKSLYKQETEAILGELREKSTTLFSQLHNENDRLDSEHNRQVTCRKTRSLAVLVLSIIAGVLSALYFANMVLKPIKNVVSKVKEASECELDFSKTINIDSKDELGELALYFNSYVGSLRNICEICKSFKTKTYEGDNKPIDMDQIWWRR